jgi:hypothetical protein
MIPSIFSIALCTTLLILTTHQCCRLLHGMLCLEDVDEHSMLATFQLSFGTAMLVLILTVDYETLVLGANLMSVFVAGLGIAFFLSNVRAMARRHAQAPPFNHVQGREYDTSIGTSV